MESTYDMVARIQEKYPVVSGEVVEDIAKSVLQEAISRQDAAQIALLRGVQQLRQAEKDGAPVTYCAGVQATYQAIVNALMTEK